MPALRLLSMLHIRPDPARYVSPIEYLVCHGKDALASMPSFICTHQDISALALRFKTMAEALNEAGEFLLSDFSKLERPALLHVGLQALHAFEVGPRSSLALHHCHQASDAWAQWPGHCK